jgi:hypothetical protein
MTSYVEKKTLKLYRQCMKSRVTHALPTAKAGCHECVYTSISTSTWTHKDIPDIAIQKMDKLSGVPDVVVIAGTFAEKWIRPSRHSINHLI